MSPFQHSPLFRHPALLARKIVSRLGFYSEHVPVPAPPVVAVSYPACWSTALRTWVYQIPLKPAPHPFNRVFHQDFDTAALLRLCHEGPIPGERGLLGDIKLVWDFSRAHALFTNSVAGPGQAKACADFVRSWLQAAGDTTGPAWICPMDVAIRAVNWIFADVLFGLDLSKLVGQEEWAKWLWRHGWVIWRRLEARRISNNHYLANLLGLLVVGSSFPEDTTARAWRDFACRDFPRALLAQTRPDGGLAEASLRYHAFVTEMALLFRLAQGRPFPLAAESRLSQMGKIIANFRDATGDVFPIGDDDSGRVLALDSFSRLGRAEILLQLASTVAGAEVKPAAQATHKDNGWWVQRTGDFVLALDFGGVGLQGIGAHAHNDDLSFCLDWRGRSVITDPGTYLYTSDRQARNRFRSTFAHNTVIVDEREQREPGDEPFLLPGADTPFGSEQLRDGWAFTRQVIPGVIHRREILFQDRMVILRDLFEGWGQHKLRWRFHLHPAVAAGSSSEGFTLTIPGAGALLLELPRPAGTAYIIDSEYSPGYGRREATRACEFVGEFNMPHAAEWRLRVVEAE